MPYYWTATDIEQPLNKGFTKNGTQYPRNWLNLASDEEKAAIGIEWIADDDQDGIRAGLFNFRGYRRDDASIGAEQVITTHARFTGDAGSDDNDITVDGIFVAGSSHDVGIKAYDGRGFHQVECLTGRHSFGCRDIEQHDVAQFRGGTPVSGRSTNVAGPDDRNLASPHKMLTSQVVCLT